MVIVPRLSDTAITLPSPFRSSWPVRSDTTASALLHIAGTHHTTCMSQISTAKTEKTVVVFFVAQHELDQCASPIPPSLSLPQTLAKQVPHSRAWCTPCTLHLRTSSCTSS